MPDITMCNAIFCPKRAECYRHTATPSEFRQSYFVEEPYDEKTGTCQYFWPERPEKK